MPFQLWHTFRDSGGNWQNFFGQIALEVSGGPAGFIDVGCGCTEETILQVVGVGTDGNLWHTLRHGNGSWQPFFGLVESQSLGGPVRFTRVACAGAAELLHVVGVGVDSKLYHTFRRLNGSWQNFFGLIEGPVSGGPAAGFIDVSCGTVDNQVLQVVGVGADGNLWHTLRHTNGSWQNFFGEVESQVTTGGPSSFTRVAAAGCDFSAGQPALHVVGVGLDEQLYHTYRAAPWQGFFGSGFTGPKIPMFVDVGCGSAEGENLQVVAADTGGYLRHTIRFSSPHQTWQGFLGEVESQVSGGPPGFVDVACAGATGPQVLHVVGVG